ncbi:TolC family protein [uncultured Ruegeria sp.]|uniref:TolC family protein n=1 Tax=uncultured Ruegeria sp. TaxID=259304 RepID=UPI00260B8E4C|nr:TolC family protein [uncultured Ruegeria sp.]
MAIETSPTLAQSDTRMDIASANRDAAEGAFLPQISLGINARSERVESDIADVSPYLRVSQLVYDGGAASGDLTAAQARVLESMGNQLQTASATALAAIETYVLVLDQRKILGIAAHNVSVHEELVRQISDRTAGGAGSNADVLTAQSRMADARTRLADARARTDRAEARFREVFGTMPGSLTPPVPAPPLERSDAQIVMSSPQVRRADASLLAAKAEWSAAQARRKPDIRVAAFANQDDSRDANFGVDLSVNYELDSTGQRRAAIAAADAQVRDAEFAREQLVREITRELGFIRSDQKAGAERLRAARVAVGANADSVAASRAQFSIGRRSLIEILDAQRDYVNAQERLILAEQSFFLTNYAALSLTGDILDLLGISLGEWNNGK